MTERHHTTPQPNQEQRPDTVRVTLYPLFHEVHGKSFTRHFPDLATWERVRKHLRWDYLAIEVEEQHEQAWQPNAEQTVYSSLWTGKKITEPPQPESKR